MTRVTLMLERTISATTRLISTNAARRRLTLSGGASSLTSSQPPVTAKKAARMRWPGDTLWFSSSQTRKKPIEGGRIGEEPRHDPGSVLGAGAGCASTLPT